MARPQPFRRERNDLISAAVFWRNRGRKPVHENDLLCALGALALAAKEMAEETNLHPRTP